MSRRLAAIAACTLVLGAFTVAFGQESKGGEGDDDVYVVEVPDLPEALSAALFDNVAEVSSASTPSDLMGFVGSAIGLTGGDAGSLSPNTGVMVSLGQFGVGDNRDYFEKYGARFGHHTSLDMSISEVPQGEDEDPGIGLGVGLRFVFYDSSDPLMDSGYGECAKRLGVTGESFSRLGNFDVVGDPDRRVAWNVDTWRDEIQAATSFDGCGAGGDLSDAWLTCLADKWENSGVRRTVQLVLDHFAYCATLEPEPRITCEGQISGDAWIVAYGAAATEFNTECNRALGGDPDKVVSCVDKLTARDPINQTFSDSYASCITAKTRAGQGVWTSTAVSAGFAGGPEFASPKFSDLGNVTGGRWGLWLLVGAEMKKDIAQFDFTLRARQRFFDESGTLENAFDVATLIQFRGGGDRIRGFGTLGYDGSSLGGGATLTAEHALPIRLGMETRVAKGIWLSLAFGASLDPTDIGESVLQALTDVKFGASQQARLDLGNGPPDGGHDGDDDS